MDGPAIPGSGKRGRVVKLMFYKLGRTLQLIGMIVLPIAIAGNLAPDQPLDLRGSLVLSSVGILIFGVGWLLQQAGKPD